MMKCFALIVLLLLATAADSQQGQFSATGSFSVRRTADVPPPPPPPPPPPDEGYWTNVLDPTRAGEWAHVGIRGGIPSWTTLCNANPAVPGANGSPLPPQGVTLRLENHHYNVGDKIAQGANIMTATQAGTTEQRSPVWPTTVGGTVQDGTITWTMGQTGYSAERWAFNRAYSSGNTILDTNGNIETVTTAGTSNTNVAWNTATDGATTTDGTVVWQVSLNQGDGPRIQAALNACNNAGPNGVVVQLTAGNYYVQNGISFNRATNSTLNQIISYVILRGAGADQTRLLFTNINNNCSIGAICFIGNIASFTEYMNYIGRSGGTSTWTGSNNQIGVYTRGANMISIGQAWWGSTPAVGDVVLLDQADDDMNICPATPSTDPASPCHGVVGATGVMPPSGTCTPQAPCTITIHTGVPHELSVGDCVGVRIGGGSTTADWIYNSRGVLPAGATPSTATWTNRSVECRGMPRFFTVTAVPSPTSFQYHVPAQGTYTATEIEDGGGGAAVKGTDGFIVSGLEGVTYPIAQGVKTPGRACPGNGDVSTGRGPIPAHTCHPGDGRARTIYEFKKILAIYDPGQNGCPTAAFRCYEIDPPLELTSYEPSHGPGIWWPGRFDEMDGVEELTADFSNDGSTSNQYGSVLFSWAYNCWVKGVRLIRGRRNLTYAMRAGRTATVDSYGYGLKRVDNQSYHLELWISSDSLVQNNICQQMANCQMLGTGINSVYGYNFSTQESWRTPTQLTAHMSMSHDNAVLSLFEGNVAISSAAADAFHGSNNAITAFRNRITGQGWPRRSNNTRGVDNMMFNRSYNYIGNIIGGLLGTTTVTKYRNDGFGGDDGNTYLVGSMKDSPWTLEPFTVASHMHWGNFDTATRNVRWCSGTTNCSCGTLTTGCDSNSEIPGAGRFINANFIPADHNLAPSFYLSQRPDFFVTPWGTPGFPAIGPDVDASQGSGNGNPSLDSQCVWTRGNGSDNTGPNSPLGCSGVTNISTNHMAYQIPAQVCYNHTPVDPFYQQGPFTITSVSGWSTANYGILTFTFTPPITAAKPGERPTHDFMVADTIDIRGVTPDIYNGLYTVFSIPARNQITIGGWGSSQPPAYVSGGTFTTTNIINFNPRTCYPHDFSAGTRFGARR